MTPHAKLRTEITDWLKSIGAWYVCTNSQGYGRKGIPDIIACYAGRFIAIEVKVLPDKPSAWQARELEAVRVVRGAAIVAYSLKDVTDRLGNWVRSVQDLEIHVAATLNTPTQLHYVPK